jgi:hypothetical protein
VFRTYGFVCAFYASGGAWLHAPAHTALAAAAAAPVTPAPTAVAALLPPQQPALQRQHTSSSSTGSTSSVSLQQPSFKRKASTHKLPIATPPDIDTSVGTLSSTTTATAGTAVTQYPTEETAPAAAAAVSEAAVTESNRFVVNGSWIVFGGSSPGCAQFSALVRSLVDRVEVRPASCGLFLTGFIFAVLVELKCSVLLAVLTYGTLQICYRVTAVADLSSLLYRTL